MSLDVRYENPKPKSIAKKMKSHNKNLRLNTSPAYLKSHETIYVDLGIREFSTPDINKHEHE